MAEEFLNMKDNNMQTPSSPAKTLPAFDDFELEWDLLGKEWSLLPISNDGPSYSPFDPYFALTGDDATDSGNIENLEPFIDPGLLNINTVATEETQPQILQEERGGKKRKPSQLIKLLRENNNSGYPVAPKATPIKGEFGPITSTVTAPRATPVKGEFGPITSTVTAPRATPVKGEFGPMATREFGQTTSNLTAPLTTPIKGELGTITSTLTVTKGNPIKRKFGQTTLTVTAPMATPIKREFVQTTSTITAPMATPIKRRAEGNMQPWREGARHQNISKTDPC